MWERECYVGAAWWVEEYHQGLKLRTTPMHRLAKPCSHSIGNSHPAHKLAGNDNLHYLGSAVSILQTDSISQSLL